MSSTDLSLPKAPFLARPGKALRAAVVLVTILVPVVLAIRLGVYVSFVDSPLTAFGMWGAFTIHIWTRPGPKEGIYTILLGIAARGIYNIVIGERGYPGSLIIGMGTFLGFASLAVMIVRSLERKGERRAACRRALAIVAFMSYMGVAWAFFLSLANAVLPNKFDYLLYHFDGALGLQPSFIVGRVVRSSRPLYWVLMMTYNCFGYWFSLLYAAHAGARVKYPVSIIKMLVANGLIGASLYFVCPAMGPKYAFSNFPNLPSLVPHAAVVASGPPNAMPSLHFAGALLLLWLSRPWKWLYRWMVLFTALTGLATLGLGEHYFIDLVVAIPYALAILAFSCALPDRKLPLYAGAGMLLFWLLALRFATFPPVIAWTLVVITVAAGFRFEAWLARRLWVAVAVPRAQELEPALTVSE